MGNHLKDHKKLVHRALHTRNNHDHLQAIREDQDRGYYDLKQIQRQ